MTRDLRLILLLTALSLGLPSGARAFGGSQVTWLGGTLPYDTVPYLEADPKLAWSAGTGAPALGLEADLGLTDWWMLDAGWRKELGTASSLGRLGTRVCLLPETRWGLGAALAGAWLLPEGLASDAQGTLIVGWSGWSNSLVLNKSFFSSGQRQSFSLAWWGPYLSYAVRPGLEYGVEESGSARSAWLLPQLAINLPGDVSVDAGLSLDPGGSGAWKAHGRLSYQLFPSP